MPPTPSKLNLSFARNAYSVFGGRNATIANEREQREQKTELLEGKKQGRKDEHNSFTQSTVTFRGIVDTAINEVNTLSPIQSRYFITRLSLAMTIQFPCPLAFSII